MGRWGTWGDDLFAMSHLLRRPIYIACLSSWSENLAPSGCTFEQEWKRAVGNIGDLAHTWCHCVLLVQFSPRTWPGTQWPVFTLQFRPPFPETEPGQLTLLKPSALQYPDASIRTYVNLYIINKQVDPPKYNVRSPHCNVHPFNIVCFSQQKTQNQQKSIEILPKSEQNHGYLSYLLYMIGDEMLHILRLYFQIIFISHL